MSGHDCVMSSALTSYKVVRKVSAEPDAKHMKISTENRYYSEYT